MRQQEKEIRAAKENKTKKNKQKETKPTKAK
jgi:hypothetical protein